MRISVPTHDFSDTAELLRRATVHVRTGREGAGSGVIWQPDGLIVTNAHVARTPAVEIELAGGQVLAGEVIAHDPRRDLAAVRIAAGDLPAAEIGNSDALRVGQLVAAVGNPLGLSGALTIGIIHAIAPVAERGRQPWVQADVHLAPGNSGGPLADVTGRVIGINSMVAGGLGLAVPSNAVRRFLGADADRPRLGVVTQAVTTPAGAGLLILAIEPNTPAENAGLLIGDILEAAGSQHFATPEDLGAALAAAGPAGILDLELRRGGRPLRLPVALDSPSRSQAA